MITDNIKRLIECNKKARVSEVKAIPLFVNEESSNNYRYCGAVVDSQNHIIGIPNRCSHILDINPEDETIEQWGKVIYPDEIKGWTGGGLSKKEKIYGFPRGASSYLEIDYINRQIAYFPMSQLYDMEHHYGGVMNKKGVIYQPPRNGKKIYCYDTTTRNEKEIQIVTLFSRKRLYYGGMLDLEDNAYFFPAGKLSRVCMVNSKEKAILIGKNLWNCRFNSGTLAGNGDIYGFSSYGRGILHIDTKNKRAEVRQKDIQGGFFGAKLGFNGKIYGIPGDADIILEYDPYRDMITDKIPLPDCEIGKRAKCAGGAVDIYGNIWCIPAKGSYIYKVCFEGLEAYPDCILYKSRYFSSFY